MRVRWTNGAPDGNPAVFAELPSSTPAVHTSRTIGFGPDGRLYVSIGSSCDVCIEADPRRTTIQVYDAEGKGRPFATGLRNANGFDWDPATGRLWAGDNGQDATRPRFSSRRNQSRRRRPALRLPVFHRPQSSEPGPAIRKRSRIVRCRRRGRARPRIAGARGVDRFAFLHRNKVSRGVSKRDVPRDARLDGDSRQGGLQGGPRSNEGRTPDGFDDFVSGWLKDDVVSGRPAGLATGADGALYVSDDNKGFIYRIGYAER